MIDRVHYDQMFFNSDLKCYFKCLSLLISYFEEMLSIDLVINLYNPHMPVAQKIADEVVFRPLQ